MIEPAQNTLLIADPFLKDPNFLRTVVYICRHSEEGSFGFVLNKLFDYALGELISGIQIPDIPVYVGGPVQSDTIHFIHQYPTLIPDCQQISDDIYWGGDFETLKKLINTQKIELSNVKFFIGYSGWANAQLQEEIVEKSWITAIATRNLVFHTEPSEIWKESLRLLGSPYEHMIHYPTDPQLN